MKRLHIILYICLLSLNSMAQTEGFSVDTLSDAVFYGCKGSSRLSKHSLGTAIDINPLQNPCVKKRKDGSLFIQPKAAHKYADRQKAYPYKIMKGDLCYRLFLAHGFSWGGNWRTLKDYQHFEK